MRTFPKFENFDSRMFRKIDVLFTDVREARAEDRLFDIIFSLDEEEASQLKPT
jgi:hypothetical protein